MRSLLSLLIIGSGQWIKGHRRKAILLFLLSYCVFPWSLIVALSLSNMITFALLVTLPALYLGIALYSALDAWQ